MSRCLCCYRELRPGQVDFHPACVRRMFGSAEAPAMDYTHSDMTRLAEEVIQTQTTLTGVQPKLSLHLTEDNGCERLTIVGLWGAYIFKPQTDEYPQLPEVEDLTMHLAETAKIPTAQHSLIRLADGELGYITKRFDRTAKGEKVAMEDLCQLSERQTEDKYKTSYEQIARVIRQYSSVPQLDVANFFELLLFSLLTGNNDMHLKNFALYQPTRKPILSPAYDLINAVIVNPKDKEELALTLNGKKSRLKRVDFQQAADRMGLPSTFLTQTITRFTRLLPTWFSLIDQSFLSDELKQAYKDLLQERLARLSEE